VKVNYFDFFIVLEEGCHCEQDYFERSVREMEIKDIDKAI